MRRLATGSVTSVIQTVLPEEAGTRTPIGNRRLLLANLSNTQSGFGQAHAGTLLYLLSKIQYQALRRSIALRRQRAVCRERGRPTERPRSGVNATARARGVDQCQRSCKGSLPCSALVRPRRAADHAQSRRISNWQLREARAKRTRRHGQCKFGQLALYRRARSRVFPDTRGGTCQCQPGTSTPRAATSSAVTGRCGRGLLHHRQGHRASHFTPVAETTLQPT